VLIETRGQGGFVIIAPSNGKVHPSGGAYELLSGGLESIVTLTPEEREQLWNLPRTFDEMPVDFAAQDPTPKEGGLRPGDDYNERATWAEVLEGWTVHHVRGDVTYWCRPGKDKAEGWSATTGHCKGLYVFTTTTSFDADESYSKFAAYAVLNHKRNFYAATKALAAAGYGTQPSPNGKTRSGPPEPPKRRLKIRRASEVVCKPVEWLWQPRVPLGMLTLFGGDPKLGKSLVALATAASVSRGASLPGDDPRPAGSVVILSAEDDSARTIVPRLKAAGANLDKIHLLESVILSEKLEALPSLRSDLELIEEEVSKLGDCRLIVVDPISAYLDGIDENKNAQVRGLLSPVKAMAERLNVAVVLVNHLRKTLGTNPLHALHGSIAFAGAARANFLFVRDRDDPKGKRVLILDAGCNLAPRDLPTLAYTVEDDDDVGVVAWCDEPPKITAQQYWDQCAEQAKQKRQEKTQTAECEEWLRETLQTGKALSRDLEKWAASMGFKKNVLYTAKERLGIQSEREGSREESKSYWALPHIDERATAP
jgi:hypothetical protein